jgi:hypothetical protein
MAIGTATAPSAKTLALTLKDNESDKNNELTKYYDIKRTNGTTCPDLSGFGFDRNTDSCRDQPFLKLKSLSRNFGKPFLPTH